ncbi:hypothetical protein LIER_07757 [Lithospermum erythrorhizon]|uniref:DUF4283 domain-containing protein n=1 Tax=Lithospermum erythrorhizon TaxID=34254 RepID=A0AAV3P9K6_LITER
MKFVLVGKFSHGRSPLNIIKDFFMGLKLQGAYNISLFDHKHLFLEFASKVDYTRVWMKLNWSIKGVPLYMFYEASLLSIANAIGMGKVLDNMPQPALTVNTMEQVIHGLANLEGATSGAGPSKTENAWQVNKAGSGRGGV